MILPSSFVPAFGLGNCHLQTTLPSILSCKYSSVPVKRERLTLPDGDFIDFDWFDDTITAPIVIILHGLTGSVQSHYVQSILHQLKLRKWRPILMYYRGCSGEPNLLDCSYHLSDTMGLDSLVKELRRREPNTPIAAVGYSMGANVLLKWLGDSGDKAELTTAVAVSTPFDLAKSSNYLRHGFSRFYQWWLIGDLHDYVRRKYQTKKPPMDFSNITQLKSFWDFDDKVTAPLNGFKDVQDYYIKSSCGPVLKNISVPTLALHAKDDPFMTPDIVPDNSQLSSAVTIELSEKGGHVGFVSGSIFHPEYWLEQRIPEHLQRYLTVAVPPKVNSMDSTIIPLAMSHV